MSVQRLFPDHVPVYFINLSRGTIRRARFEKYARNTIRRLLPSLDGPYRIEAVDGRGDSFTFDPETEPRTKTEMACLLSHLKAIHTAYHAGHEWALVCEDDMDIRPLADHWDHFVSTTWSSFTGNLLQLIAIDFSNTIYNDPILPVIPWKPGYYNAGLYLIRRDAMKHVLDTLCLLGTPLLTHSRPLNGMLVADDILYRISDSHTSTAAYATPFEYTTNIVTNGGDDDGRIRSHRMTAARSNATITAMHRRTKKNPKILLVMIVKNEALNMDRVLGSVVNLVDGVVICDTGSTDGTLGKIDSWASNNPTVPCVVTTRPFDDFGSSRTHSIRSAEEFVREKAWCVDDTYALLLDADWFLVDNDASNPSCVHALLAEHPTVDCFFATHLHGQCSYRRRNLLRIGVGWTCVGFAHEHWVSGGAPNTMSQSSGIEIRELDTGGMRPSKGTRELELLELDYVGNPTNARTLFYLGRAHLVNVEHGDRTRGRELLTRRINMDDFPEERFEARLLLSEGEDLGSTLEHAFQGMKDSATRPELLVRAARLLRVAGLRIAGCELVLLAIRQSLPPGDKDSHAWIQCAHAITAPERPVGVVTTEYSSRALSSLLFLQTHEVKYGLFEELAIVSTWTDTKGTYGLRGTLANEWLVQFGTPVHRARALDRRRFFS
jgi:GR25 family glycosyltransferase involved in LPS biosynthesis